MKHRNVPWRIIFFIAVALHICLYISAYQTSWFDIFFEHVTKGQDFFQIPNGAAAFLHGGSLQGIPPTGVAPYTKCCGVNKNVYHPLLTLLIGAPLQLLSPDHAFLVWSIFHLIVTILIVWHMLTTFRKHPLVYGACSLFLLNSYHYYEIQHAQFHFLFTAASYFLFIQIHRKGDTRMGGLLFFVSLLIKPIGLLFVIPLLLAKFWKTVGIGLLGYVAVTVPLLYWEPGKYFIWNILANISGSYPNYNLYALSRLLPVPLAYIDGIRNICAVGLLLYQIKYKPRLLNVVMLWVVFQLIFYSGVYHYYYAITSFLVFFVIVTDSVERSKLFWITVASITIPPPIILFHLAGDPSVLPNKHLSIIAIYSVFTLCTFACFLIRNMSRRPAR